MLEQFIISIQIILIDIVMAADNAIIIGLIAANFAPQNKKKIIAWGIAGAFVFRIFFATGVNYIFAFAWAMLSITRTFPRLLRLIGRGSGAY